VPGMKAEVPMAANPASDTDSRPAASRPAASRPADGQDSARRGAGPQIPSPPWQRMPERHGRRRSEPISREAIVAAAIRLLDREGLAALSMRRLAEELGTGAASLYWHVGSKDGLLDLVIDELIGEEEVPDADPARWQEQLKEVARAQRALSLRHPYLVRIVIGRIPMGPNALRLTERMLAIMRAGGLPPRLAVQGYLALIATVNGFTVDETGVEDAAPGAQPAGAAQRSDPASVQERANMVRDYVGSLPAGQFPHMVALADEFAFADPGERFEVLIDIFVDGLARRAAA
jgi:AcrR family transcriptional regulator